MKYVTANKSLGIEKIGAQLTRKYKISPALKKEIANIFKRRVMENQVSEIITLLRDDNEYYNGYGKNYLSNSDIGVLLNNPQDFGKTREDNKAFMDGRYFHQLILEPEKAKEMPAVDVSTRTTKEYKLFCEDNNLPFCMLKKEQDEIQNLVSIINGNIAFYDEIYKAGNEYETPAVGTIQGRMWKGKADIVTEVLRIAKQYAYV